MRIWAKVIKNHHTVKELTYKRDEQLMYSHFLQYLMDICGELDLPTPVLLKTHIMEFAKFRHVKFRGRDFVEPIEFDFLWVELID